MLSIIFKIIIIYELKVIYIKHLHSYSITKNAIIIDLYNIYHMLYIIFNK